jgi:Flp pilus assembly protein TadG
VSAEVVLVVPVLMLLILFSVQFGLWYHASAVARAAAQEGVHAARVQGGSAAAGHAQATSLISQAGASLLGDVTVTATRTAQVATVEVSAVTASIVPGLWLPVHATAESPVERYRSPLDP